MKNNLTLLAVLSFAIAGCTAQPQRISQTSSGNPEVIIKGVEIADVKSRILEKMMAGGLTLDSESPSRIVFSAPVTGFTENLLRVALGNSNSTPVRSEVAFTMVKIPVGVRVFSQSSVWTQMPGGQVNRTPLTGDAEFNGMQAALYKLRDGF